MQESEQEDYFTVTEKQCQNPVMQLPGREELLFSDFLCYKNNHKNQLKKKFNGGFFEDGKNKKLSTQYCVMKASVSPNLYEWVC